MSVYNEATGLPETLDGLRQQSHADFEVIVVDDGSTDQTWRLLTSLNWPLLRLHRQLSNWGQTASLNLALSMARGQYIARHDAQDVSAPSRLEQQVAHLERHPSVAAVGCQTDWVDRQGRFIRHFDYPTKHAEIATRLKEKNSFAHGSVMIRRSALEKAGFYREPFRLAQDYDLWLRLSETSKLANLPETLYTMRFSAGMASVTRNTEQRAYADLARQLANERREHGSEQTNLESAAAALERRYSRANWLTRRIDRAQNHLNWANRLLWWGPPASQYAWPMWAYAVAAWPFSLGVWKYLAREIFRPPAGKS
jgi:glycosyltransferase involved in cell wall biosynthesis